jgi:transposase
MNADVFKVWFVDMLKLLPEPCVIIMDNAPYHSMYINNYPKCNARKADVQNWLKNQGVNFSPLETLAELRERLKLLIPSFKRYELDEIACSMGHEVIRLPPYHCQYNPIELIWAQVKSEVAKKNNTFKMVDVERLTNEALDSVSKSDWEKCVEHAEKIQDEDYEKEILRDSLTEPMILTFASDDSDFGTDGDSENDVEELE